MSDLILYADPSYARMVTNIVRKYPEKRYGVPEGKEAVWIVEKNILQDAIPQAVDEGRIITVFSLPLSPPYRSRRENVADAIVDILKQLGYGAKRSDTYYLDSTYTTGIFFKETKSETLPFVDITIWWNEGSHE